MTINECSEGGNKVFSIEGRLDTMTCHELQTVLMPAFDANSNIVLDFKKLIYISSAGLRVLLLGQKTATAKKSSMALRNVSPEIMEIFSMTGFSDILTIR